MPLVELSMEPRRITQHASLLTIVLRGLDVVGVIGGLHVAAALVGAPVGPAASAAAVSAAVVYYLAAEITGLYRSWHGASDDRELLCAAATWALAAPALLVVGFVSHMLDPVAQELTHTGAVTWLLASPLCIVAARAALRLYQRRIRRKGRNVRGLAIVGCTEIGLQLARNIDRAPWSGLRTVGFFDDRPADRRGELPQDVAACVGNIDELVRQAREGKVYMIYITLPLRAESRIKSVLARLADTTASVYVVPDFYVYELLHSRWINVGGLPAVSVFENPFYGVDGMVKRMLDVVLGSIILVLATVPMLLVALAVKLSSPGPVFFKQKRYGLDGRSIDVWKFRSMRVCENGPVIEQATRGDPRVTKVGAFIRKTSLDELPQLFNVLEGTMSLVGPRPHANAHNEQFRTQIQGYMLRHKVKPGITGLAQVSGWRGETDTLDKMQRRVECDHQYIRDWSPWLDVKILVRTVFTVLSKQNAY
jgi:putative colanic acid biosynthesis UDP-glucose lipid carrier transferase